MKFLNCCIYLALMGIISFFVGRLLPKRWFHPDRFPYRSYPFERNGRVYERLKIRSWQNKVPDMSRIVPKLMPAKRLTGDYKEKLPRMIQETCVAELIHSILCFTGFYCVWLWPGAGGLTVAVLHALFLNLPFILIQRYNRPRLMKLYKRSCRVKPVPEEGEPGEYARADTEL